MDLQNYYLAYSNTNYIRIYDIKQNYKFITEIVL